MEAQASAGLRVGDAISYGWAAFKKTPGPLVVIALVVLVVGALTSGIGNAVSRESAVFGVIVQIAGYVVSMILSLGLIRVALKVTRGEEVDVADLFKTDQLGPYIVASILFGIMVAVGLIFCIVPGVILAVIYGFYGYVILGRGVGVGEGFSHAAEITKGQRGTVFLLGLAFMGINLLGALACGAGLLVSYPITIVAGGYAYRVLSNEAVAPIAP
ncbi:MAG: hypothetical protein JNK12_06285 [Acidimicrobiales bacterium]|nr:hypothetical protein [Acidimicrobiales bacterium]